MRGLITAGVLLLALAVGATPGALASRFPARPFLATAYCDDGTTASGQESREGTVAADPDVLPLGTVIRVTGAGVYSGTYQVIDTGRKVQGRHIDIFLRDPQEAKQFGKKSVRVQVLKPAPKTAETAED